MAETTPDTISPSCGAVGIDSTSEFITPVGGASVASTTAVVSLDLVSPNILFILFNPTTRVRATYALAIVRERGV